MASEVSITDGLPFASNSEPTLEIKFPTTPGFSTGATISIQTARELTEALLAKLDTIETPEHI
jgi:hypothetical protein